jgi:hypothetical protein
MVGQLLPNTNEMLPYILTLQNLYQTQPPCKTWPREMEPSVCVVCPMHVMSHDLQAESTSIDRLHAVVSAACVSKDDGIGLGGV